MGTHLRPGHVKPVEGVAPVPHAQLYYRHVGQGQPVIVLHGGPSFDHTYLLPDLDRLAGSRRLIYYDQRGRGRSTGDLQAISIATEIEDLDGLRRHLRLDTVALLGHSWGGYLALEYALRHPRHVSHLILLNTASASHHQYRRFRQEIRKRKAPYAAEWDRLASSTAFRQGDPEAVGDFYRLYFSTTILRPEHLEQVARSLCRSFTREGILQAWAIADRLDAETGRSLDFNLLPYLPQLRIPTLLIHGDHDFIPLEIAAEIAWAIPGAHFVLLRDCGHFSYLEAPTAVRQAVDAFFAGCRPVTTAPNKNQENPENLPPPKKKS